MSQLDSGNLDIVKQWLSAWWQLSSSLHLTVQSPFVIAFLQDSQEVLQKSIGYWQENTQQWHEQTSDWTEQTQSLLAIKNIESLSGEELVKAILSVQDMVSEQLSALIDNTDVLSERERQLMAFHLRQLMACANPRNTAYSNTEAIAKWLDSAGQSAFFGLQNFQEDLCASHIGLRVQRGDPERYVLGETLATTPGNVIFQNDLIELIHYSPLGDTHCQTPLLIIPPCINRFYVMDLQPKDSFVRWLLEQGQDVYMLSWVNPDEKTRSFDLDDYLQLGCLTALDVVADFSESEQVNLMGYCIGGLLSALAASCERGQKRVKTLSVLATLLDYSSPGELSVFISSRTLDALGKEIAVRGVLDSELISMVFTLMREESLFWRYVRARYYSGERLQSDPLTHWGQDSVHLSGAMALQYLRLFYQDNCLASGNKFLLGDERLALSDISAPKYVLACDHDHISPCESVLNGAQLLGENSRVIKATGGHASGVINHPSRASGYYRPVSNKKDIEAAYTKGSWWQDWRQWILPYSGNKIDARPTDNEKYPAIRPAPGKYVCG